MKEIKSIIISGGGTGGHIFPAIAIANEIKNRYPNAAIQFVGAKHKMEMEKVPQAGYSIIGLPIAGIQRKLTLKNLLVPFKLIASLYLSFRILKKHKPDCVIGVGGYASAAVLYVANLMKIPTIIQEQNSYPGLTNRILSKKSTKCCVAYADMFQFFDNDKIVFTGNPVRQDILNVSQYTQSEMKEKLGFDKNKPLLLVIGGSLGARTINNAFAKNYANILNQSISIYWQTGKNYKNEIPENKDLIISPFIQNMTEVYAAADMIISRAGALSISELQIVGKPVILIPSPNVTDDHQTKNALSLSNNEAAILVKDSEAINSIYSVITELNQNKELQKSLSNNIKQMAKPDASARIVNVIEQIIL